jgi:hypothetical protein
MKLQQVAAGFSKCIAKTICLDAMGIPRTVFFVGYKGLDAMGIFRTVSVKFLSQVSFSFNMTQVEVF